MNFMDTRTWRGGVVAALLAVVASGGLAAPAGAVTLFGLTADGLRLLEFDSASPQTIQRDTAITGLGGGERIAGIDIRPATGELYGVGIITGPTDTGRLYKVDPVTAVATPVGPAFATDLLTAPEYGVDFAPTGGRLRVVNSAGENLRVNAVTGERFDSASPDDDLDPGFAIIGVAHDRNTPVAAVTTTFGIARATGSLVTIGGIDGTPTPNNGAVIPVGPLGVTPVGDAGFDIDSTGAAFAALTVGTQTGLYTINLTSGAATLVGPIGDGNTALGGLAAVSNLVITISPATGTTFATTQAFDLVIFIDTRGRTITGGSVTLNGTDVTSLVAPCFAANIGIQNVGGQPAVRCPGITGAALGPGTHTLVVTLTFNGGGPGGSTTASATWRVIAVTEP